MDRHYYLAKLGIVGLAVALTVAGSGMDATRLAHPAASHGHFSAPAQFEAVAWQTTARASRSLACFIAHHWQLRL